MRHTITSPLLCYQAKCPSPGSPSLPNTGCLPYQDGSSKGWYDRLSEYASGPNSLFPSHSPPSPTSRRESKPPLSLSFRVQNRPGSNWQTHMNDLPCRPSCSCSSLPSTPYSSQPPPTSTTDSSNSHANNQRKHRILSRRSEISLLCVLILPVTFYTQCHRD